MSLTISERMALDELRDWLRGRFGARLEAASLFGSRARGEGNEESDLDVLVVVRELTGAERREIFFFAGDLLTRHAVRVAPFPLSREHLDELRSRERHIVVEIDRDQVPL
jgi:predicted nucleotidyltransferase